MKNKAYDNSVIQSSLMLSLPQSLLEDLEKLAEHNDTTVEKIIFSYIVEGIAGDSQILKRLKFSDQAAENLGGKGFMEKSPQEIINEFNFVY